MTRSSRIEEPSSSPRHSSSTHPALVTQRGWRVLDESRRGKGIMSGVGRREGWWDEGLGPKPLYPHHSSPPDPRSYSLAPTVLIEGPGHGTRVASRHPKL